MAINFDTDWNAAFPQILRLVDSWMETQVWKFNYQYIRSTDTKPLPLTACVRMRYDDTSIEVKILGLGAYAPRQITIPLFVHCLSAVSEISSLNTVAMASALLAHLSCNTFDGQLYNRLEDGGREHIGQFDVHTAAQTLASNKPYCDQARFYCTIRTTLSVIFFPRRPVTAESKETIIGEELEPTEGA